MADVYDLTRHFCMNYHVSITMIFDGWRDHFGDGVDRPVWKVRIRRTIGTKVKQFTVMFANSVASGGKQPSPYSVLACLTKYDPGTFEDFASEYGYDLDSYKARVNIYPAVCKEWENVKRLFDTNDGALEALQEIM